MSKSISSKNLQIVNICLMFLIGLVLFFLFVDETFVIVLLFVALSLVYLFLNGVVLFEEFKDRKDRSQTSNILKLVTILLSIVVFFMAIIYAVGVFGDIPEIVDVLEHVIPAFMIVHSITMLAWILFRCRDYDKSGIIIVHSKKFFTIIDPQRNELTHKNDLVSIDKIVEVEVYYKSRQILKANMENALRNGTLFSRGQNIPIFESRKNENFEDYYLILKTTDIYHSTILIHASYDNCLKIAETCFILRKNNGPMLKIG